MTIPLSLYIHIPWCVKKCPYCDFNSHQVQNQLPEQEYIDALIRDLEQDLPIIWGRPIQTIFIGGGTPSLFSPETFEKLFSDLRARILFSPDIEITLEANPGTVEQTKFAGFRQAGINRISLGIQSFQSDKLKQLGRIHDDQEAKCAIDAVKTAGFTNFNLDLMFGLPSQTISEALSDLKEALITEPTHLSWYQLTIEPHTHFYQFPPKLPEIDDIAEMYEQGLSVLAEAGFQQYEISAYSRSNFQCQHNRNYWEFGDYLGIGAGAHSKITHPGNSRITRSWKVKHPKQYLASKNFVAGQKDILFNDLPLDFMMNALRLYEPIPIALFEQRTGLSIQDIEEQLKIAQEKGLLLMNNDCLETTTQGKLYLNELLQLFI